MNTREPTVNTKRRNARADCKEISDQPYTLSQDFALKIQIRGRSDFYMRKSAVDLRMRSVSAKSGSEPFKLEILGLFKTRNEGASSSFSIRRAKACSAFDAFERAWTRYSTLRRQGGSKRA